MAREALNTILDDLFREFGEVWDKMGLEPEQKNSEFLQMSEHIKKIFEVMLGVEKNKVMKMETEAKDIGERVTKLRKQLGQAEPPPCNNAPGCVKTRLSEATKAEKNLMEVSYFG